MMQLTLQGIYFLFGKRANELINIFFPFPYFLGKKKKNNNLTPNNFLFNDILINMHFNKLSGNKIF
ncbi:hypothetical protein Mgra_00007652 [Meloidogyne graminicola]|uniref:Uncharacterized protein n=1 Tax=Meloidogyne graminicola TaxID=189291 RepID=A0A8S9ZHZ2_9BILA|nr:hypothetical protein Mgra_00007652 [Meloidogyne graminicola]